MRGVSGVSPGGAGVVQPDTPRAREPSEHRRARAGVCEAGAFARVLFVSFLSPSIERSFLLLTWD